MSTIAKDTWTPFMLLCAMRYSMGRSSYAVSVCCDYLRAHWFEIDGKTRATMRRDLHEELERYGRIGHSMGDTFDEVAWRDLLKFMDDVTAKEAY